MILVAAGNLVGDWTNPEREEAAAETGTDTFYDGMWNQPIANNLGGDSLAQGGERRRDLYGGRERQRVYFLALQVPLPCKRFA